MRRLAPILAALCLVACVHHTSRGTIELAEGDVIATGFDIHHHESHHGAEDSTVYDSTRSVCNVVSERPEVAGVAPSGALWIVWGAVEGVASLRIEPCEGSDVVYVDVIVGTRGARALTSSAK